MARFEAVLQAAGDGGCAVELPDDVTAELGGLRVRVRGTLNGVAFASNTMPIGGGRACLGVHKATREAANATFGDRVVIELDRDSQARSLSLPPELAEALAADDGARAVFERLAFTHRREFATRIAEARRPETRARRTQETIRQLHERA